MVYRIPVMVVCGLLLFLPRLFAGPEDSLPEGKMTAQMAESLFNTGMAYFQGTNGVPQDGKKAVAIFYKLAIRGNSEPQRMLGAAYAKGIGVEQNWNRALDFFEAAARSGNPRAQLNLGETLWVGVAGNRDLPKAFFWLSKAAAQGEPQAAGDLGIMYEEGLGVERDMVQSLKWLEIASNAGFEKSKPRLDEVMALTDTAQRSEAERQVKAFKALPETSIYDEDPEVATCSLGSYFRIPAKIFGGTKYLLPDTGASCTVLDSGCQKELGDVLVRDTSSGSPGLPLYSCPDIFIGEKRLVSLWTGVDDFRIIRQISGKAFDGLLGMCCLKNHVVCFDPDKNVFTIGGPVPEAVKKKALALPLKQIPGALDLYGIECTIEGHGPITLVIDTGNVDSISLSQRDWQSLVGHRNSQNNYHVGFGGKIKSGALTRIKQIRVGTNIYSGLIASSDSDNQLPSRLGQGFLRRHLVVLDFPHETLYLLPGKHFKDPEEGDMCGMSLWRKDGQLVVFAVKNKSPAFKSGIKADDKIISINKQPASSLDMDAVSKLLKSGPGRKIEVEVMRGVETKLFQFRLKRML